MRASQRCLPLCRRRLPGDIRLEKVQVNAIDHLKTGFRFFAIFPPGLVPVEAVPLRLAFGESRIAHHVRKHRRTFADKRAPASYDVDSVRLANGGQLSVVADVMVAKSSGRHRIQPKLLQHAKPLCRASAQAAAVVATAGRIRWRIYHCAFLLACQSPLSGTDREPGHGMSYRG